VSDLLLWGVPLAILVAGIVRPGAGLAVFAASLVLFGSPAGGPYLAVLDISALVVIAVLWRAGRPARTPVDAPAACFLCATLASLAPLAYHPPAWRADVLLGLAAGLPGVERWTTLFTWRAAFCALVAWLLFVAVRRLGSAAFQWLGWGLVGGLVPALALALGEWAGRVDLGGYRPLAGDLTEGGLQSLFFHPAEFAQYLMAATPLAVVALWGGSARRRSAALALAAVSTAVALRTLEQGVWPAVLLELLLATLLVAHGLASPRARRRAFGLLAIGLIFAAGTAIGAAVASDAPASSLPHPLGDLSGPQTAWRSATEMALDRPLLGWGVGSFSPVYDLSYDRSGEPAEHELTARSLYLMIVAERGLIGLAGFGLVGVALLGGLVRRLRSQDREVARNAGAALVSFAGLGLYGIVQYPFLLASSEWLCWIVAGAAATLTGAGVSASRPSSAVSSAGSGAAGSGAAGSASSFAFAQARYGGAAAKMLALLAVGVGLSQCLALSPAPARGDRGFGWHAPESSPEGTYQWTGARADLRIERAGDILVVPVANGHPRPQAHPVDVRLFVDGTEVDHFKPGSDWEERRIPIDAGHGEAVVLSIRADPPFRPFQEAHRLITLPESRDLRLLGVAVRPPRWESAAEAP
jgi:O-antigen ligase